MPYESSYRVNDQISREFKKIEESQFDRVDTIRMLELNVIPAKPRAGNLYKADGTDWNPGAGAGIYEFDGTNFNKLQMLTSEGALILPVLTAEPATTDHSLIIADGTSWDPGSGKGLYFRNGVSWVFIA